MSIKVRDKKQATEPPYKANKKKRGSNYRKTNNELVELSRDDLIAIQRNNKKKFEVQLAASPLAVKKKGEMMSFEELERIHSNIHDNFDPRYYDVYVNLKKVPSIGWKKYIRWGDSILIVPRFMGGGPAQRRTGKIAGSFIFGIIAIIAGIALLATGVGAAYGVGLLVGGISALFNGVTALLSPDAYKPGGIITPSKLYSANVKVNQERIGDPIPVVFGRMAFYPDVIQPPYAEFPNYIGSYLDNRGDMPKRSDYPPTQQIYENITEQETIRRGRPDEEDYYVTRRVWTNRNEYIIAEGRFNRALRAWKAQLKQLDDDDIDKVNAQNVETIYLRFCLGWGDVKVKDIFIGDTNVSSARESEIKYERYYIPFDDESEKTTNYSPIVDKKIVNLGIEQQQLGSHDSEAVIIYVDNSGGRIEQVQLNLFFPRGLMKLTGSSKKEQLSRKIIVSEINPDLLEPGFGKFLDQEIFGFQQSPMRRTVAFTVSDVDTKFPLLVPNLGFHIKLNEQFTPAEKEANKKASSSKKITHFDDVYLHSVNIILKKEPERKRGVTELEMRIKSGAAFLKNKTNRIKVVVERDANYKTIDSEGREKTEIVPYYNANAYDYFLDLATNKQYGVGLSSNIIDISGIEFLSRQVKNGQYSSIKYLFDFNAIFDKELSSFDALNNIARNARSVVIYKYGKFTLIRDEKRPYISMGFHPNNIIENSLSISLPVPNRDTPEALEISYIEKGQDYTENVIYMNLDGNEISVLQKESDFKKTEKMFYLGCTSKRKALNEGKYLALINKYTNIRYSFQTEEEGFILHYGSVIFLNHELVDRSMTGSIIHIEKMPGNNNKVLFASSINIPKDSEELKHKVYFRVIEPDLEGHTTEVIEFDIEDLNKHFSKKYIANNLNLFIVDFSSILLYNDGRDLKINNFGTIEITTSINKKFTNTAGNIVNKRITYNIYDGNERESTSVVFKLIKEIQKTLIVTKVEPKSENKFKIDAIEYYEPLYSQVDR